MALNAESAVTTCPTIDSNKSNAASLAVVTDKNVDSKNNESGAAASLAMVMDKNVDSKIIESNVASLPVVMDKNVDSKTTESNVASLPVVMDKNSKVSAAIDSNELVVGCNMGRTEDSEPLKVTPTASSGPKDGSSSSGIRSKVEMTDVVDDGEQMMNRVLENRCGQVECNKVWIEALLSKTWPEHDLLPSEPPIVVPDRIEMIRTNRPSTVSSTTTAILSLK